MHFPEQARTTDRLDPVIALVGALITFACMFVPVVVGADGQPVRPVEFAFATVPHLMGWYAATGAALLLLGDRKGAAFVAVTLRVAAAVAAGASALYLVLLAPAVALAMFAVVVLSLFSFRQRPWILARSLWISGLLTLIGLYWLRTVAEPAPGFWLNELGAAMLIIGGGRLEQAGRRTACVGRPARAAIVRSGCQ